MSAAAVRLSLCLLLLTACTEAVPAEASDAGPDAGDCCAADGGGLEDGSLPEDAGEPPDAGGPEDAGEPQDAGVETDAGQGDAGGEQDAGEESELRLDSLAPASAGASVGATVTLRGDGLDDAVRVELDGEPVPFQPVDRLSLKATFPPVALTEVGKRTVRVVDSTGLSAELVDGFEYAFDEDPIVFVHGWAGDPTQFDETIAAFRALGYPAEYLHAIEIEDSLGSNLVAARELAAAVDLMLSATGAPKVDLVAHSMGAVAGRLYVKKNGGGEKVRDFASLAGANHGAFMSGCPQYCADVVCWWCGAGGFEMSTTYACAGEARNDVQFILNGCLTDEGRTVEADETPFGVEDGGGIAYLSIYSDYDGTVFPNESPCLNMKRRGDCTDPVNVQVRDVLHLNFPRDEEVLDLTVRHVRARNRSK